MSELTESKRQQLLRELREMGHASSSERENGAQFRHNFYPVAEHLRVFEPNVNLVIGYHGAGKSMLFKAAIEHQLSAETIRQALGRDLFLRALTQQEAKWLDGYPMGTAFPDPGTLRHFARAQTPRANNEQFLADLWLAYLARLLRPHLPAPGLSQLFAPSGVEVEEVYAALQSCRSQVVRALDDLDARLKQEGRWFFINYDELDTLGGIDGDLMALLIRSLLTFWAEYSRRWQRIQTKIFLRTDLFTNAHIFTADFTKLAGSRVELNWNERNLYAMLIKRMANASDDWRAYCQNAGQTFTNDDTLGWIPQLASVETAQPLIEQIAGPFMGSTIKKGRTFTWLLDHLRDGNGQITPRALVNLLGYAAEQELNAAKASGEHLLHPTSLRRALDQVSDDYVRMLQSRDMPWLGLVKMGLDNREVPLTPEEWAEIFTQFWAKWRNLAAENLRPPVETPTKFLTLLLQLGVCRQRPDGRIDVPDLFLHGLGIKRRGGVQR